MEYIVYIYVCNISTLVIGGNNDIYKQPFNMDTFTESINTSNQSYISGTTASICEIVDTGVDHPSNQGKKKKKKRTRDNIGSKGSKTVNFLLTRDKIDDNGTKLSNLFPQTRELDIGALELNTNQRGGKMYGSILVSNKSGGDLKESDYYYQPSTGSLKEVGCEGSSCISSVGSMNKAPDRNLHQEMDENIRENLVLRSDNLALCKTVETLSDEIGELEDENNMLIYQNRILNGCVPQLKRELDRSQGRHDDLQTQFEGMVTINKQLGIHSKNVECKLKEVEQINSRLTSANGQLQGSIFVKDRQLWEARLAVSVLLNICYSRHKEFFESSVHERVIGVKDSGLMIEEIFKHETPTTKALYEKYRQNPDTDGEELKSQIFELCKIVDMIYYHNSR